MIEVSTPSRVDDTQIDELAPVSSAPDTATPSAGTLLRQAREAAGLHIAALAVSLKVPVKKLEALEADRLDLLPGAVFVRALACSVCRTLKIAPEPVLERLPQSHIPHLQHQEEGINTPFHGAGGSTGPSAWSQLSHPAVLAGLVLLLGALVLILLPKTPKLQAEEKIVLLNAPPLAISAPAPSGTASAATGVVASAPSVPGATATLALPAPAASAPVSLPPAPVVAPVSAPAMAPAVSPAPVPAATAATAATAAPVEMLQLKAGDTSWVAVTDAKGKFVFRRPLIAGESVAISGVPPLSAVIGRADVVTVQIRGKPFDLKAFTEGTVARFEVK